MSRFVRWLKRPVPLNYATVVFCFLEGAAVSLPVAILLQPSEPPESPNLVSQISVISFLLLPLWCIFVNEKRNNTLVSLGIVTFALILVFGIFHGLLSD